MKLQVFYPSDEIFIWKYIPWWNIVGPLLINIITMKCNKFPQLHLPPKSISVFWICYHVGIVCCTTTARRYFSTLWSNYWAQRCFQIHNLLLIIPPVVVFIAWSSWHVLFNFHNHWICHVLFKPVNQVTTITSICWQNRTRDLEWHTRCSWRWRFQFQCIYESAYLTMYVVSTNQ